MRFIQLFRTSFLLSLSMIMACSLLAQGRTSLGLSEAYKLLAEQYPDLQSPELLRKMYEQDQQLLKIARLPMLQLKADGRLQSQSTQLETNDAPLPFEINQPLVSSKLYVEAQYLIYDGGMNQAQGILQEAHQKLELQQLEITQYQLQERINQLFLNIELLRKRLKLFDFSLQNLEARRLQIEAAVEQGVILESELKRLEVKLLELKSQQEDVQFRKQGLIETLSDLIGLELSNEVELSLPAFPPALSVPTLNRPEQELFRLQREAILAQSELIEAKRKPKLSAFAQGGTGYPNPLNILDNNIAPFGLVGFQFQWQIWDWKEAQLRKEQLALKAQRVNLAEESFEFQIASHEANYRSEVQRLQLQLERAESIAQLQNEILQQLSAQLDEGVITSADYLDQLNAELIARQTLLIHQTKLSQTQLNYWNLLGQMK